MFTGKHVVILGAARQGKALARYLTAHGARVVLNDAQTADKIDLSSLADVSGLTTVFGAHPLELLDGCDLLCLSGGVPIDLPIVLEAARRGIPVGNDAAIFMELCPAPVIGITGSAGKTTTTTLTFEMLRAAAPAGRTVWVGGNIGNPLIDDLDAIKSGDQVVMELSSFQLEQIRRSPRIACVTNITPNHLDRHGTMEAYIAAKRHIVEFQSASDIQVLNADDSITRFFDTRAQTVWFSLHSEPRGAGAWLGADGVLRVRAGAVDGAICHRHELLLMGAHNILNVLAAAALSASAGAGMDAIRQIAITFKGVAHRLQLVGEINGARYYDDSIATAPERLMAALRCFDQRVILLCGGRDKHLPWDDAVELMRERCKQVILFGEMGPMVARLLGGAPRATASRLDVEICNLLEDAVALARATARPGDIVLLSPGGTSYDAFKDFAERGDRFRTLITAA
jgi:UDP-N-acetylmuramoylalanine--D-glutamate ligase